MKLPPLCGWRDWQILAQGVLDVSQGLGYLPWLSFRKEHPVYAHIIEQAGSHVI
jgi:hypothetical protein